MDAGGEKMKKISTPTRRAYYLASPNETSRVLCWMPADELVDMAARGEAPEHLIDDHPDGLEVEVSEAEFAEFGINLAADPADIRRVYLELLRKEQLPPSGMVDGRHLEREAMGMEMVSFARSAGLPEPSMSEGEDVKTMLKGL
jgi:hypothetical protein